LPGSISSRPHPAAFIQNIAEDPALYQRYLL
jgi:hypothetical protein